jgi:hypothetical protein
MITRIYNDNVHDHREKFRGDWVEIKAGGFIEMQRDDAVLFKGNFFPPKYEANGLQDPKSFKKLRLVNMESNVPEPPKAEQFICTACGFQAKNKIGLMSHIRHNHADQMIDEEARDKLTKEF